jgi:hypothetical protein
MIPAFFFIPYAMIDLTTPQSLELFLNFCEFF